jgi:FAD binding domain-containing protein/berberine-like enzyme
VSGAVAADVVARPAISAAATDAVIPTYGPVAVTPSDARYPEMVTAFNRRWTGTPDYVVLAGSTSQVRALVQAAVTAGKRISVRGGGHCYADFVYNPSVQAVLDMSLMNHVYFDTSRYAFAVEGGAVLGDVYPTLFRGYGVTLPGGHCPGTGIGGHATGGGHGMLSRQFGLITDHIAAVEMVVVDSTGTAKTIVAERNGANSDLWWAVSGGGGGNFGVITRYWFRSPSATGTDPGHALPNPPQNLLFATLTIPWSSLTATQFANLVNNMGTFFQNNSSVSSPYLPLCSLLTIPHVSSGPLTVVTLVDASATNAAGLLANFHAALTAGTGISPSVPYRTLPWMAVEETINTATPLIETNATFRNAVKSANLIQAFTPAQISSIYANMTRTDYNNPLPALLQISSQAGGVVNTIAKSATAIPYRSSSMLAFFHVYWTEATPDATHLGWLRDLYGQVFASTGGYPVFNSAYEGCVINLPDLDAKDPTFNRTGLPWQSLFYDTNYPRLQQVKAKYDPTNFFRHSMSITAT